MYYVKPYFTERAIVIPQSDDPDASPFRATRDASPRSPTERTALLSAAPSSSRRTLSPPVSPASSTSSRSVSPADEEQKPKRSVALDLNVLRACILIEIAGFLALATNSARSAKTFVLASAFMTLGSASSSALNSLALGFLSHQRETGRLFGGMAVLQSSAASLISPLIFSNLFAAAVSTTGFVEAIFYLAAIILVIAFIALLFVRLPPNVEDTERGRGRERGRSKGVLVET